jgi:hypothetical protein
LDETWPIESPRSLWLIESLQLPRLIESVQIESMSTLAWLTQQ